ncbi:MAG TPA: RecQ family ATP-dependent DNA helicase, partial [Gammaproteobacteria bacterium]|nr:RecQ family ATP-dependent DNA helicase [Gammaproteobacteria bacterium]
MLTPESVLKTTFGFDAFRGRQAEIVDAVVHGQDALVLMPTGGGKSLCYQIPALLRPGVGIVVSPLIALMADQVAALKQYGVAAAFLNSSLDLAEQRAIERQMVAGELDLVYIAPERLMQPRCLELLKRCEIALFAIDEAHCVSQWGHDFRPEYMELAALAEQFPQVPRIALTATADPATRAEIAERLQLGDAQHFIHSFDRPNIRYRVAERGGGRTQLLRFIRGEHEGEAGIVYCLSRNKVEQTAAWLCDEGFTALPYHAGLDHATRDAHQRRFVREDGVIIVATVAFGMGIDKPDVRYVAHMDLPASIEAYYQETGRAGRDGQPAEAWMS